VSKNFLFDTNVLLGKLAKPEGQWYYDETGGFTAVYPLSDAGLIAQIRRYQSSIRTQYPGWTSLLEIFNSAEPMARPSPTVVLRVFPLTAIPAVTMSRRQGPTP
jgi:hypothetical protein